MVDTHLSVDPQLEVNRSIVDESEDSWLRCMK
jgi:hypothetical protein